MFSTYEVLIIAGVLSAIAYIVGFRRGHIDGFTVGVSVILGKLEAMPNGEEALANLFQFERGNHAKNVA